MSTRLKKSDGTFVLSDNFAKFPINTVVQTIPTTGAQSVNLNAPFTGKLVGAFFTANDALAANDTNYLTFSLTNLSNSNAAMFAASDPNTTKATGGTAITANGKRNFTLHATAGNKVVAEGDRLRFTATQTGTLANTLTLGVLTLVFERTI